MELFASLSLGISILILSIAQILLKKGTLDFKNLTFSFSSFVSLILSLFQSKTLFLATILFAASFVFYVFSLSKIQLSIAQPLSVAISLILVLIGSWVFLGEKISTSQFLGIALMMLGILLIFKKF